MRTLETARQLQVLQNFSGTGLETGNTDLAKRANPLYVGLNSPTLRIDNDREKEKKNNKKIGRKREKRNKN